MLIKNQGAKKVTEVHLEIGEVLFLGKDQIQFSYDILVKNTIMSDSKLIIEEKKAVLECSGCSYRGDIPLKDEEVYHVSIPTLQCPNCGKTAKIVEGKSCTLNSIKMIK